jgi:hypothetical protein
MATYRVDVVTSGIPEPLHTQTFDAPDDPAARRLALGFTKALVSNPEEEYGVLMAGPEREWVDNIKMARDEEDAR